MSRQTKIIIGIVAGVIVLCLAICVVGGFAATLLGRTVAQNVKADPAKAAQTASSIADITPPDNYQATTGFNMFGYTFVLYEENGQASNNMVLMQMPTSSEINEATIQQMQQAMERQAGRSMSNVHTVDSRSLTIRGKPAQEIIQEGTFANSSTAIRQMLVAFQGKGGVAMLMITGPADTWNQTAYDQMVSSIR